MVFFALAISDIKYEFRIISKNYDEEPTFEWVHYTGVYNRLLKLFLAHLELSK